MRCLTWIRANSEWDLRKSRLFGSLISNNCPHDKPFSATFPPPLVVYMMHMSPSPKRIPSGVYRAMCKHTHLIHFVSDVVSIHDSSPGCHSFVTSQHAKCSCLASTVYSQETKTLTHGDPQGQTVYRNQWRTTYESKREIQDTETTFF